jgi:hypothetical protein
MFTGKTFFYRVFTWLDIVFYSLNCKTNNEALFGDESKSLRSQRIL